MAGDSETDSKGATGNSSDLSATVLQLTKLIGMQQKQLAALTKLVEGNTGPQAERADLVEALSNAIERFSYDPTSEATFGSWYAIYSDIFEEQTKSMSEAARVRLLLHRLDTVAHKRYADYILPDQPKDKTFKETVAILTKMFQKPESQFCRRWKCFQIAKKPTEDFTAYAARVNKACEDFHLKTMTVDEFKCLIYILGLNSHDELDIRSRLHSKLDADPKEQTTLAHLAEEAARLINVKHDTQLGTKNEHGVLAVSKAPHKYKPKPNGNKRGEPAPKYPCWRCGAMHFTKDCTFTKHTCKKCSKVGHKEGYCAVWNSKSKGAIPKTNVITIDGNNSRSAVNSANEHAALLGTADQLSINICQSNGSRKQVSVKFNNNLIRFQLDTGSDLTIITKRDWELIGSPPLEPVRFNAVDAQNNPMPLLGSFKSAVQLNEMQRIGECFVSATDTNLLGAPWLTLFDLWDKAPTSYCHQVSEKPPRFSAEQFTEKLKEDFADVFSNTLGRCEMLAARLHLKPGASPVFRPKRQVPFRIISRVDEELERLQMAGIISPVDHSDFAAPIVIVQKANGGLRICADYSTGLNKSLLPHEYPIPTPDSIFANLANCAIFSQVDLSDAYLQIPVDDEARKMLTINTHRGLFSFNRLCPGVKPAAGIFMQVIDKILVGISRVQIYFDDLLIATPDWEEHQSTLLEVFNRLKKFNIRARLEKCKFFQKSVKFLGFIVDDKGLRPDMDKIEAIVSMPPPNNQQELHSFIGAIGFYMKFVKSMSALRAPLDHLMKKDVDFEWTRSCQEAFDKFKEVLQSDLLLMHYNPDLPITIATDASQYGIGAVAYHTLPDGSLKAFYHASRRLTTAESKYSQIEKEALGIVFAVKKFHVYVWGRKFCIQTDHRPLLAIFSPERGIPQHTANRLQRWALVLMAYDFELSFVRTQDFGHADLLSRLIADRPQEDFVVAAVREDATWVTEREQELPVKFVEIGIATDEDAALRAVRDHIINGWPSSIKAIQSGDVKKYFAIRDSLSINSNVVVFRDRTVIPPALRKKILKHLHATHPGITRMKALARSYVFWPGLDQDIMDIVAQCQPCRENSKAPRKTELSSWCVPSGPWQRVHIDFMGPLRDKMYLVIMDAYAKWPEVYQMGSTTAEATVTKIAECCARFGSMNLIVSDNGPQFASAVFAEFCSLNNIRHLTSPPYHPQSNGQAEAFVGHLKRALQKQNDSVAYLQRFLQNYRATRGPHTPTGESPAELMLGRRIILPIAAVLPPPEEQQLLRNEEMERAFNKQHHAVPRHFEEGEKVVIRTKPGTSWLDGTIIERVGSVLYIVFAEDRLYRLHCNQIKKAGWQLPLDVPDAPASTASRRNPRAVTRASPPVLRPRPSKD